MTPEQKATHLQRVEEAEAVLAAFKAELVVGLGRRPAGQRDRQRGQTGAASGEWAAQLLDADVSEFFPDELALVLNCSRAAATQLWERSTTLRRRLPATWAALADGWLDWPRARAIAAELGWPARESPDDVLAAVEAVVLPQATGLSITRLRALVRAELIRADPAAADRRRKKAERDADVTVRGVGDGMGELRATMPSPEAAEMRAEVDAHARALKKAGDERPIGQLRSAVLHDLVTRAWQERPAVSAHVEVVASLDTLECAAAGAPGAGREPVLVDGEPVTAALARELLERLDALCPGGLQAPTDGTMSLSITDEDGRLIAAVTRRELETAVRRGEGLGPPPAVDRYEPTPAQTAIRTHPRSHVPAPRLRQPRRLGRPRPRRRARRGRGDRLRQPVLPVPPAPPVEDARPRLALRDDAGRRPDGHHAQWHHARHPTAGHVPRRRHRAAGDRRTTTPSDVDPPPF